MKPRCPYCGTRDVEKEKRIEYKNSYEQRWGCNHCQSAFSVYHKKMKGVKNG
jgi:transposase-like protein